MGIRHPALPFSHLDSQTDATGLSDNVFFLGDYGQWKLGRVSQLLE